MTLPDPLADPLSDSLANPLDDPGDDPRTFWAAVGGVAPDQLVFPPGPSPLMRRWTTWLARHPRIRTAATRAQHLWRIFWFGPHHPDPAPLPRTPLNLAPWTNQLLPHPDDGPDRPVLIRLHDRILWHLSHPATRFETHAWRRNARADAALPWHLHRLRRTLAGKPPGPPPWLNLPQPAITAPHESPRDTQPEDRSPDNNERKTP